MNKFGSWKEAIEAALTHREKPLHYREIWSEIKQRGLYETNGITPENTINYIINKSIKEEAEASPFLFHGDGIYSLRHPVNKVTPQSSVIKEREKENTRSGEFAIKESQPNREDGQPRVYAIDDILAEDCFLPRSELERIIHRLCEKKNLILQGPPGTGKSWLAKRLGMALVGQVAEEPQLRSVQFHPNISYEDFVRGWRPGGNGGLVLREGIFMQMVKAALEDPGQTYVLVIEEINRGNPAQIFGELLTLLEAGKRTPRDAMQLCYPDPDGTHRPVYVPENMVVIGTMNIADRSLALEDIAFRRRFAFIDLEPCLGETWREWVVSRMHMDPAAAATIQQRLGQLNAAITADSRLGKAFQIGHSYVTPTQSLEGTSSRDWFAEVVASELKPLLHEYWFDAPEEADRQAAALLEGW